MFDLVRKNTKIIGVLLFLFIVPSFVFLGVDNYRSMNSAGNAAVAEVNGEKITQTQWDERHRREADDIRSNNPDVDPALLDSPQARYATLERMVQERVLAAAANNLKLFVSDQRLARELLADPNIAALKGADGKLDEARYREALSKQGLTPQTFEAGTRAQLAQQQVVRGPADAAGWIPAAQADLVLRPFFERRDVQLYRFKPADFQSEVQVTDAGLQTYYKAHAAQFRRPEQASVQYVVLDLPAVEKKVTISEQDLRSYYEQNKAHLAGGEQRRASHILIAADQSAGAEARAAAKKKAEEVLAEVKQNPQNFADLAKRYSQDPGSAAQGGDLGFFDRQSMVKPFSDAVYALKPGEISPVVETQYGYHIIRLTDVQGGDKGFERSRAQIEVEVKRQQAQQKFAEAVEQLSDAVFRDPQTLKTAADKLGLEIHSATGVTRMPARGAEGALANAKLLDALFAPDSIKSKNNTATVEIGSNQVAAARIVEYQAARQPALDEVRNEVAQGFVQSQAAILAKAAGENKLKEWRGNAQAATGGENMTLSRAQAGAPAAVVNAAMRANRAKLPAFEGADLGGDGYVVVRVNSVLEPDAGTQEVQKQQYPQVAQAVGDAELQAYYESLKKLLKVKMLVPKPSAILATTKTE